MHPQASLGQAEAYINVHLSRSGHGSFKGAGPFVTISRESGSGGSAFAQALETRLARVLPADPPWTVFDRNLVETMLQSEHLSPRIARFMPEDKVSEIDASIGELLGLHPSIWNMIQRTNDLMRQLARAGNAIIVGRGANCATESIPGGLHVRLVASPGYRARFTASELNISEEAAASHNLHTDAARRNYVRSVFATDVDRASGYDLVINVGTLDLDAAVEMTVQVLRSRVSALTPR